MIPLLEPSRRTSSRSVRKLKPAKALQGWWAPAAYSDGDGRLGARGPGYSRLKWPRVPGLTLYRVAGRRAKALPVLVPELHLGCPSPKSNLLETINFSAGHLYLPARATKWSPGSALRRRQVCQGDWSSVTIRVFQSADATTPMLTYSLVDPVP